MSVKPLGDDATLIPEQPARKVTAFDIGVALMDRYRRTGNGYWPEITVTDPVGELRLDGVALEWSYGNMWIHGFEVKISRSDFLRDSKYTLYRKYCDTLTLVCPRKLIDRNEVPDGIGLMWYDPKTHEVKYRRKPEYDAPGTDTSQITKKLLKTLTQDVKFNSATNRWGHFKSAQDYVDQKTTMKNIGQTLGSKMALRLQQLEHQAEPKYQQELHGKAEAYKRLAKILSEHGFYMPQWEVPTERTFAEFEADLSSMKPTGEVIRDIENLRDQLNRSIEQLKNKGTE